MEMFQPNLTLSLEPDGEFTLDSVTITPNSCYSAGRARRGVPANVRITPETFSVLLPIRARSGPCLMALRPVRHQLRNLDLRGKTSVLAFAIQGDQVLGSSSIPVVPASLCSKKNPIAVDTSDWYAWVNLMPPGPTSFHVTGNVQLPTPGYSASLEVATPQGINPQELILDLVVKPLPGIWPQVITTVSVRYDQSPYTGAAYKTVLIREPDGDATQVTVEEAH